MPSFAIFIGILLDILGIAGYVWTGSHSPTALIPAVIGTLLLILGIIASRNPDMRKQAMHIAAIIAALGFLGSASRALPNISKMFPSHQVSEALHPGSPTPGQMGTEGAPDQIGAPPAGQQTTALNQIKGAAWDHHHAIAFWMQSIMALLCLIFLIACIRSFINARRNQPTQYSPPPYDKTP
ncbi:MAG: hypothetical protein C5B47_08450 [Verrucomicrobia bacterium]|nr:MAG: hypothetical protein C5B47_08450 [Verrucomicrobiota bacterium]